MNYLLDTHLFIWLDTDPDRVPSSVMDVCVNLKNDLYLSVVSPWEIQIKQQVNKLKLAFRLRKW